MIPFPASLTALYPPPEHTFPGRPWWSDYRKVTVRIDLNVEDSKRLHYSPVAWFRSDGRLATDDADVDRVDREFPVPFLGIRVGQVYAYRSEYSDPGMGGWYVNMITSIEHSDAGPRTYYVGAKPASECFLLSGPGGPWSPPEPKEGE